MKRWILDQVEDDKIGRVKGKKDQREKGKKKKKRTGLGPVYPIFFAARNLAERDDGLSASSSSVAVTGLLVRFSMRW